MAFFLKRIEDERGGTLASTAFEISRGGRSILLHALLLPTETDLGLDRG
jgi:hypothetical protein